MRWTQHAAAGAAAVAPACLAPLVRALRLLLNCRHRLPVCALGIARALHPVGK